MLRQRLVLVVVAGSVSFGTGAAFAATHSASHPVKKPIAQAKTAPNVRYPCHNHGAKLTAAQV